MPGDAETKQPRRADRWAELAAGAAEPGAPWPATASSPRRRDEQEPPAYYDLSMLKPPVWTAEVGQYFFLGGLSAYAFVFSRLAERFGGEKYRDLTRLGTAVAAATALPCAPLLVWDLGDRKRFHHMLRVWKPGSPMNLGSWVLTAYTVVGGVVALREFTRARRGDREPTGITQAADVAAGVVGDAAGVPLAVLLAGYTGVLLSTTATPIWAKNPWIGALFSASAVGAGAGAVRLALEIKDAAAGSDQNATATEALGKIETAARAAEAVAHAGYLSAAGGLAKPLTEGKLRTQFLGGAIGLGLVLPEIVSRLPLPQRARPWAKIAAGAIGLVGGYMLRSAFVAAGRLSARDPEAARVASKAKSPGPWETETVEQQSL